MRYIFKFPDIGEGIIEGKILEWYIKKGQSVKTGDALVKMETDKVVTDIPSPRDGVISALFGSEGDVINVDDSLVEIEIEGAEGEEAQAIARDKPKAAREETVNEKGFGVVGTLEVAGNGAFLPSSDEGQSTVTTTDEPAQRKKALATPVARAMARDLGININQVKGSGTGGRVMKADIKAHHSPSTSTATTPTATGQAVEYVDLTQIRKAIARKMVESKHSAAHMTVMDEVEVSKLVELRRENKADFEALGTKLTYLPFILKAVAQALKDHPTLNSELDMDKERLILKKYYNLGIAVDTDDGLVVPVIRNVDSKSILELSRELLQIAEKSRQRKLTMEDFKDGSFSVTNYGSIGGTFGVPVINYPQAAILGIGRIKETPVVKDGEIAVGQQLQLSLSVDHRIVDGGEATRFMNQVIGYLQYPVSLLLI